jgi:copper resistance protein D
MGQFLNIYGFLAVLLRATTIAAQSLIIGGALFAYAVLGRWREGTGRFEAERGCERLLRVAGVGLALTQAIYLCCESFVLRQTVGLSFAEIAGANFFLAGIGLVACGILVATISYKSRSTIWLLLLLSLGALLSTVATSHAFSRLQGRAAVVGFTALHLAATGCWIGGLPYLLISLKWLPDEAKHEVLVRYSRVALLSVGVLVVSGIATALHYVDSLGALYGTAYGIMLLAKAALLGVLLVLGAVNRSIVKHGDSLQVRRRLQHLVGAEAGIGIAVVLTAASMTSQPPAIDLVNGRVDAVTVLNRFKPEWPRLRTPALTSLSPATRPLDKAAAANGPVSLVPGEKIHLPNSPGDIAWSEYNHNWMGLLLIVVGLLATISRTGRLSFARHWPLAFLLMGAFIFLRADPENWPLGPNGFWESFDQSEVLQHRLAVALVATFAFFEWRVQLGKAKSAFAPLVFPMVCVAGGMMLMTHSHALNNVREELLAEMSHLPLALLAIVAGWSRWLQLRLPARDGAVASWIWPVCFVLMGAILLDYREG